MRSITSDGGHERHGGRSQLPVGDSIVAASSPFGEATAVTMLLSDWNKFGLSERVCYHFDLIETLTTASQQGSINRYSMQGGEEDGSPGAVASAPPWRLKENGVCGVVSLLECVPVVPTNKLTLRQRRAFQKGVKHFNIQAQAVRKAALMPWHEPRHLPLRMSPNTRVAFVYEVTRVAFCLDASPTLTSTFGNVDSNACCSLDRLPDMVRTFFRALVEPITMANSTSWKPEVAVTVVAVYPRNTGKPETSVLVRDFRVHDATTARLLSDRITQWALTDVENEIASRMDGSACSSIGGYGSWRIPTSSSALEDLLDAGDVALGLLPFEGRPCIVVATDCRSMACDSVLDRLSNNDRVDTPLFVLDLSSPESHVPASAQPATDTDFMTTKRDELTCDNGGPWTFPLHLSDDSETLHSICNSLGGCFLDSELLRETANTIAGQVPSDSNLHSDHYLSFRRRSLRPNALQWYVLFAISPLSPTLNPVGGKHPAGGKLIAPRYMRLRQEWSKGRLESSTHNGEKRHATTEHTKHRITFSSYVLSPIRIKGLLLMRIKEGYRARQYGQNTLDSDRFSIQFTLPIETSGTVLHYELTYKASKTPMVGLAHIKIEVSGDPAFIKSVKEDFLSHGLKNRPTTIWKRASSKLCKVLRWFRKEDCLQSYLCPMEWSNESPLLRRLGTLNRLQRHHHFRQDKFDVLCVGDSNCGRDKGHGLFDAVSEWSTQTIIEGKRYVKKIQSAQHDLPSYCVVEVKPSASTSRLFSITLESFGGISAMERLPLLISLQNTISSRRDIVVLPLLMGEYLAAYRKRPDAQLSRRQRLLENHYHHDRWELVHDPEFLPLLTKRMTEIGNFWLLDSTDSMALFVKFVNGESSEEVALSPSELHLVQYQVEIVSDKVVINIYMDTQRGSFFPFRLLPDGPEQRAETTLFQLHVEKVRSRDQECCLALRSRTNLLSVFDRPHSRGERVHRESDRTSVERLLAYASRESRKLRFFQAGAGMANNALEELTTNLMVSEAFSVPVSRLSIGSSTTVGELEPGIWFLVQHDEHTLSIASLALTEKLDTADGGFSYRDLTFFTIGISDLYYARDDIGKSSAEDHTSCHMCVSDFADKIEATHGENYARAAYLALRRDSPRVEHFHPDDFSYVLKQCTFVEATSVMVSQEIVADDTVTDSKLSKVICNMFSVVPCWEETYFFYHGEEMNGPGPGPIQGEDDTDGLSDENFDDDDDDDVSLSDEETQHSSANPNLPDSSFGTNTGSFSPLVYPPLFVRFNLDNKPVSLADLARVKNTSCLSVHISLFHSSASGAAGVKETLNHLALHSALLHGLRSSLNAYVAEQNLERSRSLGPSISEVDLNGVKSCLRKAHNVVSSVLPLDFYVAKRDSMVHSSAPAGGETSVEESFSLLRKELQRNNSLCLKTTALGGFFVEDTGDERTTLSYWCFLDIRKQTGVVSVEVYHPAGMQVASEVLTMTQGIVAKTCHRVNRMLLLQSLHRTRNASSLLIPKARKAESYPSGLESQELITHQPPGKNWPPGYFSCPVQFRTRFTPYYRCAASQVVQKLEATVLDSFAVSNRRGVFVYKDETGAIFYMSLNIGNEGGEDFVELLVFGIDEPGPSVTHQLRRLLQKRLLSIAVDSLSSLLTKNPLFNWKSSDLQFIRSFEIEWSDIDQNQGQPPDDKERIYEFPPCVYDPLMVLVYFRQNICGSTYFHRLHVALEDDTHKKEASSSQGNISQFGGGDKESADGITIPFDPQEFSFFFNNSPSPLDPDFQPVCTLTTKGSEYARQAGNGIALIDVALIRNDGLPMESIKVGASPKESASVTEIPTDDSLRVKRILVNSNIMDEDSVRQFRVRVQIISTAANRDSLHSWVELTLNQTLIAWSIERHLEKSQVGLLKKPPHIEDQQKFKQTRRDSYCKKKLAVDRVCVGLPGLMSMLRSSYYLPHPAIERLKLRGIFQASSLAKLTLDLLEKCIMPPLLNEKRVLGASLNGLSELSIIRTSATQNPGLVNLSWEPSCSRVVATDKTDKQVIRDAQIDCPEYTCFYCFHRYSRKTARHVDDHSKAQKNDHPQLPLLLFREVMIGEGISDKKTGTFSEMLLALKTSTPYVFHRSLVFVLRVSREQRSLFTYNWEPTKLKHVKSRLRDFETTSLNATGQSLHSRQARCLGVLSPTAGKKVDKSLVTTSSESTSVQKVPRGTSSGGEPLRADTITSTGVKSKTKPLGTMRRPKLIGKSVEGAAMQAMAYSRARASAYRFKGGHNAPVLGTSHRSQKERTTTSRNASSSRMRSGSLREKATGEKTARAKPGSESQTLEPMDETSRSHSGHAQKENSENAVLSAFLRDYQSSLQRILRLTDLPKGPYADTMYQLLRSWWNEKECRFTPLVTEFVLTQSIANRSTASKIFTMPPHVLKVASAFLAQSVCATMGFEMMDLRGSTSQEKLAPLQPFVPTVVYLTREIKRLHQFRYMMVVRICTANKNLGKNPDSMVQLDSWMVILSRIDNLSTQKLKWRRTTILLERDFAAIDKSLSEFNEKMILELEVFNFAASFVEHTAQMQENKYGVVSLLREMIKRFPVERQESFQGLNYRVIEARLVLPSYLDSFISLFGASVLFSHLQSNSEAYGFFCCGTDGVCAKEPFSMFGTRTYCFLTQSEEVESVLQAIILCRTDCRSLEEFVQRDNSPHFVTLRDRIIVETARVARDALRSAAIRMRRDYLWECLSSASSKRVPSSKAYEEVRGLVCSTPLGDADPRLKSLLLDKDLRINWTSCCSSMREEPQFKPGWSFHVHDRAGSALFMFYLKGHDVFLTFRMNDDGSLLEADMLSKDDREQHGGRQWVTQVFTNYLLHYIWTNL